MKTLKPEKRKLGKLQTEQLFCSVFHFGTFQKHYCSFDSRRLGSLGPMFVNSLNMFVLVRDFF